MFFDTIVVLKTLLILCCGFIPIINAFSSVNYKLFSRSLKVSDISMVSSDLMSLSDLNVPQINELALPAAGISVGLFGIFKIAVYSRMQLISASMVGGIPTNYKVVELDAIDGKNGSVASPIYIKYTD